MRFTDVTPATRKAMQGNKAKDTRPEMAVRRLVHAMGFRYRLRKKALPGRPDLVFGSRRKVIFVHGCFWHQHPDPCCAKSRLPGSRFDYWVPKFEANKMRDQRVLDDLRRAGFAVMIVWECDLRDPPALARRLRDFISGARDGSGEDVRSRLDRTADPA